MRPRCLLLYSLLILFVAGDLAGQPCSCREQLDFVIRKVEQNYAGFADKVHPATASVYAAHTSATREKAAGVSSVDSCLLLLKEWVRFFRDGHLVVFQARTSLSGPNPATPSRIPAFSFTRLDASTNLLRIGSFNVAYKRTIDSLIEAHDGTIRQTRNLLIDLRGNGGGSDVSYHSLLPLLYTGPVITPGAAKLSTPDNIAKYRADAANPDYPPAARALAQQDADRMAAEPGRLLPGTIDTLILPGISPFPALVGILTDKGCGSTTEQFLLAALQSKKTVLLGETSRGVLDYANMHFLDLPCSGWKLGYATSRSMRLPRHPVDNTGISPDIRIDPAEKDWVSFAERYLQQMPALRLPELGYTDTTQVDMKSLAASIAGSVQGTFNKVRVLTWWTNRNLNWNFTDYQRRTAKQVLCQQGGNCNEQALVLRALLRELGIQTRKAIEINIQPESERRQKDAAARIQETGNRASVFGYRHNDHVWVEFFDAEEKLWQPADATLGLIGLESWLKARIGFAPRVNHAVLPSADMLIPIAVFALGPDGAITENRSSHYLLESFNTVYGNRLTALPSWKAWTELVEWIQEKAKAAFEGKENLHEYTDRIKAMKAIYEQLKKEYAGLHAQ